MHSGFLTIVTMAAAMVVSPCIAADGPLRVKTPRGAEVEMLSEFPPGAGPFPTLVLAPGQGYHMGLPRRRRPRFRGPQGAGSEAAHARNLDAATRLAANFLAEALGTVAVKP